ncbi:MAG: helix-turn-helix domain-containing protein [Pseudomonadota bacterium]
MNDKSTLHASPQGADYSTASETHPGGDGRPPRSPSPPPLITAQDFLRFFWEFCTDDSIQEKLIQHFNRDVIAREMRRRNMIEPLMTVKDLAKVLGLSETAQGLYKKIQANDLGIPYVPMGRGGGYKFDPRDVRDFIERSKVYPIRRPDSLRGRRRAV